MITQKALNLFYENNIKGTPIESSANIQRDILQISGYSTWSKFDIENIDSLELSKTSTIKGERYNTSDENYVNVFYALTVTCGKSKFIFEFSEYVNMEGNNNEN